MRVLLLEDERTAANHLEALLRELEPSLTIVAVIDSVEEGLARWSQLPTPDLILSDIQLADGLSFSLLEQVAVHCPIIFTTAYDEYAIRAFRHNSIDYLLKPIEREALEASLQKYRSLARPASDELVRQMQNMLSIHAFMPPTYRTSFLIQFRDKLLPIKVADIAYFSIEGGVVSATIYDMVTHHRLSDHRQPDRAISYPIEQKLEDLDSQLDPRQFFRANRQFIVARNSISEAELYFNGRLQLKLKPAPSQQVLISKDRANLFKKWMEEF
ncbi:response regulator transcription factor [Spirosoma aureum]|uniref:Response regulator transcription factor n=1 Tax=Spirosoma aureum TaxID=2692134 RepID=A0A6G9ARS5_9BACT|nr:LytTR family DNA-binding domain-containing protein [Spirosoma aureum]QIP14985.1 response regulator transcription factor [Spirosoma aureum]